MSTPTPPPAGSDESDQPTTQIPGTPVPPPPAIPPGPVGPPPGQPAGGGMSTNKILIIGAAVIAGVILCGIGLAGSVAATAALVGGGGHGNRMHRHMGEPEKANKNGPKGGQGRMGHMGGLGGPGSAIPGGLPAIEHGDIVVTGPTGTAETLRVTRGQVTTVNATSIVVKATDGYVGTYTVSPTTTVSRNGSPSAIGTVQVGDTATVVGTLSGTTATATRINALDAAAAAKEQQRLQQRRTQQGQTVPPGGPTVN